ncbi:MULTISPECIES: LiaF transmembrane domain-containing protein [Xanthomonas]|uniref:DUF5668 domain-containing protein n=1 Tax=Xanthomonas cucurbitae TaxID=56453 RepID=A0ABY7Y8R7_9XANT|nr:DUF5668 domain-containing protein [Xanthomonas cucurbitae]QHG87025.1 hypothetical protein EBN15_08455 [Xanthomonas cucurbitae]WDM66381.1 DUF5668 domain-containing protein [Xanthomonas cucurbitae]WDM70259.1 DUF5668 domain-containing protein [Xanthomonas cucurbitae]WDM76946.1 DUF5668 domain-containing protein [Xanthomonas cucurbitae]
MQRLIPGLFLIVLGGLFLLNNLGLTRMNLGELIAAWWPLMLIWGGIHQLVRHRQRGLAAD